MHFENNIVDLKQIFDKVRSILDWSYTFSWDNGQFHFTFTLWEFVLGCLITYGFFYIFNKIYE